MISVKRFIIKYLHMYVDMIDKNRLIEFLELRKKLGYKYISIKVFKKNKTFTFNNVPIDNMLNENDFIDRLIKDSKENQIFFEGFLEKKVIEE